MLVSQGLMLIVIMRLFGQCVYDLLEKSPEEEHLQSLAESWANLSRLPQAMKLFEVKRRCFDSKEFELSPELHKFCARKTREPNKIRFGPRNRPKAHQSWVILRSEDGDGVVYQLPLTEAQVDTVLRRSGDITNIH